VQQQSDILKKLTKEDIQATAKQYLPADKMFIVVVGDNKQLPALKELGYPVVELDLEGKPVVAAAPAATEAPAAVVDEKIKTKDGKGKTKVKTKKG
jgi:zinc protease